MLVVDDVSSRRLYSLQQLEIAFAVHERMLVSVPSNWQGMFFSANPCCVLQLQYESVQADEAVYRALLDICGR